MAICQKNLLVWNGGKKNIILYQLTEQNPLMKSIKKYGFKQPIVIDTHNVVVVGHTRLKAAIKLGLKTVPCVVADDLSEQQIKAYRLVDNKIAELAEWDEELLNAELETIFDEDMLDFGFVKNADPTEGLDLDDEPIKEQNNKIYTCPKCGFVFEVAE